MFNFLRNKSEGHAKTKVLFIAKKRQLYGYPNRLTSSGLYNSARFVVDMLNQHNVYLIGFSFGSACGKNVSAHLQQLKFGKVLAATKLNLIVSRLANLH